MHVLTYDISLLIYYNYLILGELINEVELGALYSFSLIPFREFCVGQYSNQLNLVFEVIVIKNVIIYVLK